MIRLRQTVQRHRSSIHFPFGESRRVASATQKESVYWKANGSY